jgi:hypothetical protein
VAKRVHCAPVMATLDFAFHDWFAPAYGTSIAASIRFYNSVNLCFLENRKQKY